MIIQYDRYNYTLYVLITNKEHDDREQEQSSQ